MFRSVDHALNDRFYGKAYFNDNINFRDWGGGVRNNAGTLL